jgi:biopolymer transport protein ExbD
VINFEQSQADERVKLPRDELARPPVKTRPGEITINIGFKRSDDGTITSDPFVLITGEGKMFFWPKDKDGIVKTIERIGRSRERDEKLKETTIIIRADSFCNAGIVTDIVSIAQDAKFEKFAFSATQKGKQ